MHNKTKLELVYSLFFFQIQVLTGNIQLLALDKGVDLSNLALRIGYNLC